MRKRYNEGLEAFRAIILKGIIRINLSSISSMCIAYSIFLQVRAYMWPTKDSLKPRREGNPSIQKHQRSRPAEPIARTKPPGPRIPPLKPVLDEIRHKPRRGRESAFMESVLICIINAAKYQRKQRILALNRQLLAIHCTESR